MLLAPFAVALAATTHGAPTTLTTHLDSTARLRAEVAAVIDPILKDNGLRRAKVGVHVVRLDDGVELYSHDADNLLVPASNVKLVTTAAALMVLGPDYQFPTEIYGTLRPGGQVAGDLVIKGYGDPYLVPERVWYLASRLYFAGVRDISGDLVIDDSYFDGQRMALGWEQDKTASAYMAPAGAVSVGFNSVLVHVLPGLANQEARILLDPASTYAPIVGSVRTVTKGRSSVSIDVAADGERDTIKVSGQININDSGRGYWRRINNPPLYAGEVLRGALHQLGVTVGGKVRVGLVPAQMPKVMDYSSSRLAELIGPLNKYSNNFMAMQVAFAMGAKRYGAPGNWDKGRQAIEEFLTNDVQLPKGSYVLNNASGLHDVNRLSPRQVVRILEFMHRQPQVWPEFANSLAVASGSGTLADRMSDTAAAHILRAKTGTLSSASALSGYVTAKSGETLAFSVIVNGYQSIESVWQAQDHLGASLAAMSFVPPATEITPTTVSAVAPVGDAAKP